MIVSIPKEILFIPQSWNVQKLYVYALSRSCIGISPKEIVEWKVNALHWEEVDCVHTPKTIKFKLPDILFNFYSLVQPQMKYSLSGNGDVVLMILEWKGENIYEDAKKQSKKN
jgi:hypothetical protein